MRAVEKYHIVTIGRGDLFVKTHRWRVVSQCEIRVSLTTRLFNLAFVSSETGPYPRQATVGDESQKYAVGPAERAWLMLMLDHAI